MPLPFVGVCAVTSLALGAAGHSTAVLVLPMDARSESQALAIEGYAATAVQAFPGAKVMKTEEMFPPKVPEEAVTALREGESSLHAGTQAFERHKDLEAEQAFQAARRAFGKGAAALQSCGKLCDTLAMMAASLERRADIEGARAALLDIFTLDANYALPANRFNASLLKLQNSTSRSPEAHHLVSVEVQSEPSGAKVLLDGAPVGTTPLRLATLALGPHLIRLERPGFYVTGKVVQVDADEQEVKLWLTPVAAYSAFLAERPRIGSGLEQHSSGAAVQWGAAHGFERMVVGVLHMEDEGTGELDFSAVDVGGRRLMAERKMRFKENAYGQLGLEVDHAVTALLNNARQGGGGRSTGGDPLDGHGGIESWNAEDRGGHGHEQDNRNKSDHDPLNGHNGTEGW